MASINYLAAIDIGKIQSWNGTKDSSIFPITLPGEDADKVESVDTLGISAFTSVAGRLIGTFSDIQDGINDLKFILDGNQQSSSALYSPFINTVLNGSKIRGNIGLNTSTTTNKLVDTSANFSSWQIREDDFVKNLTTGNVARVDSVDSDTKLTLKSYDGGLVDIFPTTGAASGTTYAVTAHIEVNVLSFAESWGLPALNYCDYAMSFMQVLEE